jgi:hypothetical protein
MKETAMFNRLERRLLRSFSNVIGLRRPLLVMALYFAHEPVVSFPGQISIDAFTDAAVVQDFELLGPATQEFATPLTIDGDIYTAVGNILRSSSKFGPFMGRSGVAVAYKPNAEDAIAGLIEIEPGEPVLRAGVYVGFEFAWAAEAQFYARDSSLLGTIALAGMGRDNQFAGWQADTGRIGSIRIIDMTSNERGIWLDDFIREVPEPSSSLVAMIATLIASRLRWVDG